MKPKEKKQKLIVRSIRMSEELLFKIERSAKHSRRTFADYVRCVLEDSVVEQTAPEEESNATLFPNFA